LVDNSPRTFYEVEQPLASVSIMASGRWNHPLGSTAFGRPASAMS
jgi:hypothetical protein